jgi:hypothetical protein
LLEFNTDYKLVKKEKLYKNLIIKPGTLFIATHNYEHKDILITFKYFEKEKTTRYYMLFADKPWNYLLEPLRPNNIEFIYVKEKTVDKISSKLCLGHSVIMFLYKESDSTGPYYIIRNTNCPVTLLKIKKETDNETKSTILNHYNSSFQDIYINNFMAKFILDIKSIKYHINSNTNIFMKQIKQKLYS